MQEILTSITANLSPEVIAGNAALALMLVPTQCLVDAAKERINEFINKVLPFCPEKLFCTSLIKSLREYSETHDGTSARLTADLLRKIKADKERLYECIKTIKFSIPTTVISEPFPARIFADALVTEYGLDLSRAEQELVSSIIMSCINDYKQVILKNMDEKSILLQVLETLISLKDREMLFESLMADTVTKSDVLSLKNALLGAMRRQDNSTCLTRDLEEYDRMIEGQYRYIEFAAGFSPRISARDVRMKMSDVFINLECRQQGKERYNRFDFDLSDIVLRSRFNVLLGDPGCGKTTLLKKIAFDLSSPKNRTNGIMSNFIPLYFRLSDYSKFYKTTQKSLSEYLQQMVFQFKEALFGTAQLERSLVFLMDGLDEIADTPLRINVVEQVNSFVFANPQYIYFITSRIVGYRDAALNGIFQTYRLEPLNDEKIEKFIFQWHMAVEENTDNDKTQHEKESWSKEKTSSLISAINKNDSVKRLSTNPLLLTIITLIHFQGGRLPNKRVELYDICAETFLQHWINRRVESADAILDRDLLIDLLSRIAFYIHENYDDGLIPENDFQKHFLEFFQELSDNESRPLMEIKMECHRFIDFIRTETGIFFEKGQDESGTNLFGFLHLTFEEYFAAIEFKRRVAIRKIQLKKYIILPRWREIILLCAALFGGQAGNGRMEASCFVKDILRAKELFPPMYSNLRLAMGIMSDDVRIEEAVERQIWQVLKNALETDQYLDFSEEMKSLSTSVLYRDKLRTRIGEWSHCRGILYLNSAKILLHMGDQPECTKDILDIPDNPDFPWLIEQGGFFYFPYYPLSRNEVVLKMCVDKLIQYINSYPNWDNMRFRLLNFLDNSYIDHAPINFVDRLVSVKDKIILSKYLFCDLYLRSYKGYLEESLSNFFLAYNIDFMPKPNIIVHNKIMGCDGTFTVSSLWHPTVITTSGQYSYSIIFRHNSGSKRNEEAYQYILIDSFFAEIQIATYPNRLTSDEFMEIFGLNKREIQSGFSGLESFLQETGKNGSADLLKHWGKCCLSCWKELYSPKFNSKDEEKVFIDGIRSWMRSYNHASPIQFLLGQMILERYEHNKKIVTQKAIREAIAFYMAELVPDKNRKDAREIITMAIQAGYSSQKEKSKHCVVPNG